LRRCRLTRLGWRGCGGQLPFAGADASSSTARYSASSSRPGYQPTKLWHRALLKQTRVQLLTDEQPAARQNAGKVVAHYEKLDRSNHSLAREARFVAAEADLVLHLFELSTDRRYVQMRANACVLWLASCPRS
jgi:hypothetical protein